MAGALVVSARRRWRKAMVAEEALDIGGSVRGGERSMLKLRGFSLPGEDVVRSGSRQRGSEAQVAIRQRCWRLTSLSLDAGLRRRRRVKSQGAKLFLMAKRVSPPSVVVFSKMEVRRLLPTCCV